MITGHGKKLAAQPSLSKLRLLDNSFPPATPDLRLADLRIASFTPQPVCNQDFAPKSFISRILTVPSQSIPSVFKILHKTRGEGLLGGPFMTRSHRGMGGKAKLAFALLATLLIVAASSISAHAQAQPNGVQATSIPLFEPAGIAYDAAGNMYIAELNENLIRNVFTTTVADPATLIVP